MMTMKRERFYVKQGWRGWHVMDRARPGHFVLHQERRKETARIVATVLNSLDDGDQFRLPRRDWPGLVAIPKVRR